MRTVMAVAHTMLIIAFHVLRNGCSYHEFGGHYLEKINKDQLQLYFVNGYKDSGSMSRYNPCLKQQPERHFRRRIVKCLGLLDAYCSACIG